MASKIETPEDRWRFPVQLPSPRARRRRSSSLLMLLLPVVLILLVAVGMVTGYLEKWLWMRELNYTGIFWTLFSVQWIMFIAAFVGVFLYLWINLREATRILTMPGTGRSSRAGTTHCVRISRASSILTFPPGF